MNKLFSFIVVSFLLASVGVVYGVNVDAWKMVEVTATSDTIKGPLYVKSVYLSTPTENIAENTAWAVLLASPIVTLRTSYVSFTSAQKLTAPMIFTATNPITNNPNGAGMRLAVDFPEPGVFVSTDCGVFKTHTASGEAFKAFILYRK